MLSPSFLAVFIKFSQISLGIIPKLPNTLAMSESAYNLCIRLGNLILQDPVILAPMSGVTDRPFRQAARACGAKWVVSEMIASRQMIEAEKAHSRLHQKRQTDDWAQEQPMIVQIAGCEPFVMAEAAKLCADRGATVVDINFGCPAKKITQGQIGGAALMRDELQAARILETVVKAVSIPVTLKMRTGWDMANRNAPTLAKIAEASGIQMLTIHGRTREQFYAGQADWNFIQNIKNSVQIPVIANGDITSGAEVDACLKASGADGVMVGRGALGQPWLIGQLAHYLRNKEMGPTPSIAEQGRIHITHYQDILATYGLARGVKIARKHLGWALARRPHSAAHQAKMNALDNPEDVIALLQEIYFGGPLQEAA